MNRKVDMTRRKFSRDEALADVFVYIERFYNRRRRYSKPGYLSPMEIEDRTIF
jgi:putative transposase